MRGGEGGVEREERRGEERAGEGEGGEGRRGRGGEGRRGRRGRGGAALGVFSAGRGAAQECGGGGRSRTPDGRQMLENIPEMFT